MSLMAFQNPTPIDPCRSPTHAVSIIPKEARRKHKGVSFSSANKEPTSPKVSCMGQVQNKKKRNNAKKHKNSDSVAVRYPEKKLLLRISNKGSDEGRRKQGGKGLVLEEKKESPTATLKAPTLDTMKKFASGRASILCDFDATVAQR